MDCLFCKFISGEIPVDKVFENEDMITILVEEDDKVIGICMVSMRAKTCMVKRRTAYMEDLCVDESYRGKGIGKKIFLYAISRDSNFLKYSI